MAVIRVLIIDGAQTLESGLGRLLTQEPNLHIVGQTSSAEEMTFLLPLSDLLLVSATIGHDKAGHMIRQARETHPEVKAVVVGLDRRPDLVLRFVEAGAVGYVLQHDSASQLARQVRLIHEDKAPVSPDMAAHLIDRLAELSRQQERTALPTGHRPGLNALTPRQLQVLALVSQSMTNEEIGQRLHIARGTVKNHVHNILKRLDVSSRQQAAMMYQTQMVSGNEERRSAPDFAH
ncbi:MAG: response regulator transcription factor [Candidatus Promineifilaceae bacterium]|nr:response regulator transcription factor [Candidatus Promineifilaceae bacterium]